MTCQPKLSQLLILLAVLFSSVSCDRGVMYTPGSDRLMVGDVEIQVEEYSDLVLARSFMPALVIRNNGATTVIVEPGKMVSNGRTFAPMVLNSSNLQYRVSPGEVSTIEPLWELGETSVGDLGDYIEINLLLMFGDGVDSASIRYSRLQDTFMRRLMDG